MSPDWARVREQFPALRRWVYLNSATYGQLPRCAAEAVAAHFRRRDEMGCTDFLAWFDEADRLRNLCATLVHATAGDIAFFPSASSALSVFLGGVDWRPGGAGRLQPLRVTGDRRAVPRCGCFRLSEAFTRAPGGCVRPPWLFAGLDAFL